MKNWRPLTLLNCDYKIASKAIASRIKTFLPKLISDDQTGFIKGRCISENKRLLDSVIKFTEGKQFRAFFFFLILRKLLIHLGGLSSIKPYSISVSGPRC